MQHYLKGLHFHC